MIWKHWIDTRGVNEVQLFTYQGKKRLVYQINKEVVGDETVEEGKVDEVLHKMIREVEEYG